MNASQGRPVTGPEPSARHIAVALIPKAGAELRRLKDRTSLSGADVVNRAIISYAFLDAQLRDGQDLLIRDSGTGATMLVRFI
jgi:hypothetical protein